MKDRHVASLYPNLVRKSQKRKHFLLTSVFPFCINDILDFPPSALSDELEGIHPAVVERPFVKELVGRPDHGQRSIIS